MIAKKMYASLTTPEEKDRLRIFWYTGKDQAKPLNAKDKSRNCHVKIMSELSGRGVGRDAAWEANGFPAFIFA